MLLFLGFLQGQMCIPQKSQPCERALYTYASGLASATRNPSHCLLGRCSINQVNNKDWQKREFLLLMLSLGVQGGALGNAIVSCL
jgi:hypothetical protein